MPYIMKKVFVARPCAVCKKNFTPKRKDTTPTCSNACKQRLYTLKIAPARQCKRCKSTFYSRRADAGYCTKVCYNRHIREKNSRDCIKCGERYVARRKSQTYCTKSCMNSENKEKLPKSDAFSWRWELLWRLRPDLHELMSIIEKRVPADAKKL